MDNQDNQIQKQPICQQNIQDNLPNPSQKDIQAFIISIKSGSIQQMKEFINKFSFNICNRLQSQLRQPPLYFAAVLPDQKLSHEMVKMLVEAGANPNFKDANQQTIMFYICRDGKKETAKYLIQKGCNFDEQDLYGQTPVFYAVSENKLDILQLIPDQLLNHVDKLAKQTPLYYSARKGHFEMCKLLIQRGCDPCHLDTHKKTPIQYAKKARFQQIADYLNQQAKKLKKSTKLQVNKLQIQKLMKTQKEKKKILQHQIIQKIPINLQL